MSAFAALRAELVAKRRALPRIVADALDLCGGEAERRVVQQWPVDTGLSARNWMWRMNRGALSGTLSNRVEYVPFVWHGLADRLVPRIFDELESLFREIVVGRLDAVGRT